jgi:hypothetical protein
MLTRRIDPALTAMSDCKRRLPQLREIYEADSPQAKALDEVLASIDRAKAALFGGRSRGEDGAA